MSEKNRAINIINNAINECMEYRSWCADQSRKEKLPTLKPGEVAPDEGVICGEKYKELYKGKVSNAHQRAHDALESWRKTINNNLTDAPSEEALRAIQAFKLRNQSRMSLEGYASEIQRLIDRYGDNYQVNQILKDMAFDRDAFVPEMLRANPAMREAEDFEFVESTVNTMFSFNGLGNIDYPVSAGRASWCTMQLEGLLDK